MCKVYTGYHGKREIEHVAKARGLSLRTGAQTMLYLSLVGAHMKDVIRFLQLSPLLGILTLLYISRRHIQSSFQFAIKNIEYLI